MGEESVEHRVGMIAVDQRRAERRVGVNKADKHGGRTAVTPALDPHRKKPEQASCRRGYDQSAGVGCENRRGREREGGLIKDIRLKRARGKLAPCNGLPGKRCKRPPLRAQQRVQRSMHGGDPFRRRSARLRKLPSKELLTFGWTASPQAAGAN